MNLTKLLFSLTPMSLMAATTVDISTTAYPTQVGFVTLRDALNSANAGPDTSVIQFLPNIFGGTIFMNEDNPTLNTIPVTGLTIGQTGANMTISGGGFQLLGFQPAAPTSFLVQGITFEYGTFNLFNPNATVQLGSELNFGPSSIINVIDSNLIGNLNLSKNSSLNLFNLGSLIGNVSLIDSTGNMSRIEIDSGTLSGSLNLNANTSLIISNNGTILGTTTAKGLDSTQLALISAQNGLANFNSLELNGSSILHVSGTGVVSGPIIAMGSNLLDVARIDLAASGAILTEPTIRQYTVVNISNGATLTTNLNLVNYSQLNLIDGNAASSVIVDPTSSLVVLPPGGSINNVVSQGTTSIASTLTTNSYTTSGLLQVALNSPSSGLINTQTTTLGGTVQIAPGSNFFIKGSIAPIMNYNTGSGSLGLSDFDRTRIQIVTPSSKNYPGPSDVAFANTIYLLLKANYIGNTQFSGNAGVVQNYLQYAALNPDLIDVITAINLLPTDSLQQTALDRISPSQFGAFDWAGGALMNQIASLLGKQGICNCSCYENEYVWVATIGQFLNQKIIEELHSFDADAWGVFAGYERQMGSFWSLGVMGGYSDDYLKWHTNYGKSTIQQGTVGLHANYCEDRLDIDALALFGWQHYSTNRDITIGGLPDRRANSHGNGWITTGRFQIEKAFDDNDWTFIPFGLVEYTYMYRDPFKENGAESLNLNVRGHNASFFRAEIGPSIARTLFTSCVTFTPMFRFGWNWIVPTSGKRYTAVLEGQTAPLTVLTTKQTLNFPAAELCCVFDFHFGLDIIVSYENQFASQFNNQNAMVEFAWEF